DLQLSEGGVMHEGLWSTKLGLRGIPAQAETVLLSRDLELVELTGARYHAQHLSTRGAVELIRNAKRKGLPVTADVSIHHLLLGDDACASYDPHVKLNPPLRSQGDRQALREGLLDGTLDAIVSDHWPQGV